MLIFQSSFQTIFSFLIWKKMYFGVKEPESVWEWDWSKGVILCIPIINFINNLTLGSMFSGDILNTGDHFQLTGWLIYLLQIWNTVWHPFSVLVRCLSPFLSLMFWHMMHFCIFGLASSCSSKFDGIIICLFLLTYLLFIHYYKTLNRNIKIKYILK